MNTHPSKSNTNNAFSSKPATAIPELAALPDKPGKIKVLK